MEDSLEEGFLVRALVENEGLGEVVVAQDGMLGAQLVGDGTFDLVICDLNLPGKTGEEVVRTALSEYPDRPVIVTTGYSDPEIHARARESGADRVLTKPLDREEFVQALWSLLADARSGTRPEGVRTVLAVGAMPGDVELGCGGILAGLARDGSQAVIVTLMTEGGEAGLAEASRQAAQHLGARVVLSGLTRMDPRRAAESVRDAVQRFSPDTILVPSRRDRSEVRQQAHDAALEGAPDVPHVYAYQSPTATIEYRPHLFASVEKVMGRKLKAVACFEAAGAPPHLERGLVRATARYWSRFSRHPEVEPLELLRSPPASREEPDRRHEAA